MPQLNGGGGDDLGANDEMIPFKDEGEQEEKISENVSAERDLDDVKSSLVNESENNSSSSDSEVTFVALGKKDTLSVNCLFVLIKQFHNIIEVFHIFIILFIILASREASTTKTRFRKLRENQRLLQRR